MSKKSLQDFQKNHGDIKDLDPIRQSQCLFFDKNKEAIIYKLNMNQSQSSQWQAQIEIEIKHQNQLAQKFKQYLKISDYAFEVTEQNKIVYMTIQTSEENTYPIFSFSEINDKIVKQMKFRDILKLMSDLEASDPKIFYLQQKNLFYLGNQLYLTIFGCYNNSNDRAPTLKKLEELTNNFCTIQYKDENDQDGSKKMQKYKEDLGIVFQQSILKITNIQQISIYEINNKCRDDKELENIAQILKDYIFKDGSIEQVNLSLKQRDESQQIQQKVTEDWEKLEMILQLKLEQHQQQILKQGLDLQLLKELSPNQLTTYVSIQKQKQQESDQQEKQKESDLQEKQKKGDQQEKQKESDLQEKQKKGDQQETQKKGDLQEKQQEGDQQEKQKAKICILQAEYRQQAINLMQNNCRDPHPNLIYFLNEKELNQLKENTNLLKQFNRENQLVSDNVNKYLELLQKISSCVLDQQVFTHDQLKLIPIKILKACKNNKIKEFCKYKQLEMMKNTHGVERFEFEKALEARLFYDKFLFAINNRNSNENPLDYKLTFQQITLLDEIRKKTYQEIIYKKINVLKNSKNKNDQVQLQSYIEALNENFKQLYFNRQESSDYSSQLYQNNEVGLVPTFNFDFQKTNSLKFSEKLYDFLMRQFSGNTLIDLNFQSFLRDFNKDPISNYIGNLFDGKKHGLGLRRINENHLKFGIFSLDQIKWGWEIILQKPNIISFYKGNFFNEQKHEQGILRQYNFQMKDPIQISEYVGMFQQDKRNGWGSYKNLEKSILKKGDFKDDQLNGFAYIYENYQDLIFIGYFLKDQKHGFGKEINLQNNYQMSGDYYEDKYSGEHIKIYQDGSTDKISYPLQSSKTCLIF